MESDRIERTLCGMPVTELADFPTMGFRARTIARFERDLGRWLETSEGRFARWTAEQLVDEPVSGR
jgi:hypothetical protein